MLSSALATLILTATAVSAVPQLSLKVLGADSVHGVQNFKVTALLKNTGDEPLRILNDPRGPLSTVPTKTFEITDSSGLSPHFTGVKIKYSKHGAVKNGNNESWTDLAPGQSVKVEHNLAEAYNFNHTGQGAYDIAARSKFHYVNLTTNQIYPIYARAAAPHKISVTGQLTVPRSFSRFRRRDDDSDDDSDSDDSSSGPGAGFKGCSADQQKQIQEATVAAKDYATASYQYLSTTTQSTDRYTTWWGEFSEKNHKLVTEQYRKLSENDFAAMTYDCNTCNENDSFAYVYPEQFGTVYLCPSFWKAPLTGTDSKGGTLVHETSHFNKIASTEDVAYGQDDSKKLARESAKEAINNADSHEYFSENNPALQ